MNPFQDVFDRQKRHFATNVTRSIFSDEHIQHSAHIAPGREGLFNLIKSAPATLRYEHGVILADKEFVSSTAASRVTGSPSVTG
jgi:hypothetical protein